MIMIDDSANTVTLDSTLERPSYNKSILQVDTDTIEDEVD